MPQSDNLALSPLAKGMANDKPSYLTAYLSVIATSLLYLSTGAVMGWSSPIIPQLNLTTAEKTLVGSLYSLGATPGPFVVSFFLDLIGRKGTLYILLSTFVTSWALLLSSKNVMIIYIARIISGIGVGGTISGIPVFVAELAVKEVRGRMGTLTYCFISAGSFMAFAICPHIGYYPTSIYGLAIALLFAITFFFVPESPYYYMRKGRRVDAKAALQSLRRYTTEEALEAELAEIEKAVTQEDGKVASSWQSLTTRAAIRGIGIGIFLVMMQQFSGGNPINTYFQEILDNAKLNFSTTVIPLLYPLSSSFSLVTVVIINRWLTMKRAVLISGFGNGVCLALAGLYFLLINNEVDLHNISFISVVLILSANIFACVALGPVIWPLVAEILPATVKGIGSGICGLMSSLTAFALIALFSIVSDNYGYSTSFFGMAALLLVSTVLAHLIVPDTSGKSLQEIQELLSK